MVFEYPTNFSNGTVVNSAGDFFFGWVGATVPFAEATVVIVWLMFFSLNVYLKNNQAITIASFVSLVVATLFWWGGMLGEIFPIALLIMTGLGIVMGKGSKGL